MFVDEKYDKALKNFFYLSSYALDPPVLSRQFQIRQFKNFPAFSLLKSSKDIGEIAYALREQFKEIDRELERRASKKR